MQGITIIHMQALQIFEDHWNSLGVGWHDNF